jgi:hypothetical protein
LNSPLLKRKGSTQEQPCRKRSKSSKRPSKTQTASAQALSSCSSSSSRSRSRSPKLTQRHGRSHTQKIIVHRIISSESRSISPIHEKSQTRRESSDSRSPVTRPKSVVHVPNKNKLPQIIQMSELYSNHHKSDDNDEGTMSRTNSSSNDETESPSKGEKVI